MVYFQYKGHFKSHNKVLIEISVIRMDTITCRAEYLITRMTTFIKTNFNKSDDQTNIDNIELLLILNSIR